MTETNSELIRSSAAALADKLAAREVSAVEVTQAHLDRIAAVDGKVHAFLFDDFGQHRDAGIARGCAHAFSAS